MSSYDDDREADGAYDERVRISKLLAKKSYLAGDGVRTTVQPSSRTFFGFIGLSG